MIKLTMIGNLGRDCIIKEVNGRSVINFSICHTEKYKNKEGVQIESKTWVECAYWTDKTAVAQWLTTGRTVYVEGTPEADAYLDKHSRAMATLRLRCANIQLLGGGKDQPASQQPAQTSQQPAAQDRYAAPTSEPPYADDLPF